MFEHEAISGYTILSVLGRGAHSTIYYVRSRKDGQRYALKQVQCKSASEEKFILQALTEYRHALRVDHSAVRKCYKLRKLGFFGTREVLVLMEYLEGETLSERRPATLLEFMNIFLQVSEGMEAMHKAGLLHADMKPNNIVVTPDGQAKIIDLGQSCAVGTIKERVQGTPDYIAPEQVRLGKLTPKTDIFNLGATMYWCLTQRHVPTLIPNESVGLRDKHDLRPPHELNTSVSLGLSALIIQCVQESTTLRPESMSDIRRRLEVLVPKVDPAQPLIGGLVEQRPTGS